MKRVLSIGVLILAVSIGTSAQRSLGDYVEIDGVPAFVFSLDETGEHGLAMSIPAFNDKELTLFAHFYYGGLGRSHSLGLKFQYHADELTDNKLIRNSLYRVVLLGLFSSSCHFTDAGFRKLRCETTGASAKYWLEFFDSYTGQAPLVCAVHAF